MFKLNHIVLKLMVLPVHQLPDIMTVSYERKGRPVSVLLTTAAPGHPNSNPWSLYQVLSWLKTLKREFFVRSGEQNPCPCCGGSLIVIGSRKRKYINGIGEKVVLVIRRLQCSHCTKVHHELPDILTPYKRYGSESIEAVVSGESELTVAADESTITRWKHWFLEVANYLASALVSIAIRYCLKSVEGESNLPQSPLQRIWQLVGNAPHWLARTVRPVVNANCWVHTRSALLSG